LAFLRKSSKTCFFTVTKFVFLKKKLVSFANRAGPVFVKNGENCPILNVFVNLAPNRLLHELGEENSVNPWTGGQLSMRQNMSLLKKLDNFLQKYSIVKLSSSAIHVKIQLYVHQMCVTFHYRYMLKF
jgi:hypothetical protein